MSVAGIGDTERGMALGAAVGFLLARVVHFEIGLGLVVGALFGVAVAFLFRKGEQEDNAWPRD